MAPVEPMVVTPVTLRDHGFHRLRVSRIVPETADACTLVFEVPEDIRPLFGYEAGQFCNLRVEIEGMLHVRCYSMSSAPAVDEELAVTVKRVPEGLVSNWICDHLAPGDTIDASPPSGFFQLTATADDLVAFAAGSGITPIHSLVKEALTTSARPLRLLYANRDRASVIFADELAALERDHGGRLRVVHRFDDEHGLLDSDAVRSFTGECAGSQYYICGPAPFMEVVERALLEMGAGPARLHIERFTPAELPDLTPVVDRPGTPTRVTIELAGRSATADHRPGTTILQTARQLGLAPPFSCESGSCASCMARLVDGAVSMRVNNALTPDEVDEGWILTCQSVPTSPDVHVVYED